MYLACHTEISASAALISIAANIRAASTMSRCRTLTWSRSAALYCTRGLPEKNRAVLVWAGVRTVELTEPSALTSAKSRAYRAEVSAGGGGGANWVALRTSSGATKPSHGADIGTSPGGVGRQTPGAGGWVNVMGALRPS